MRRLAMGLSTLFGPRRRGYFIPNRYAETDRPPSYGWIEQLLRVNEATFAAVLETAAQHKKAFATFGGEPPAPRWEQDWFPRLDAIAAYIVVQERRPRRIVEIGSGHSTRVMARALADAGLGTTLTCIDPAPRASLQGLSVSWISRVVQEAGLEPFASLAPGDILFVDSSHTLMPGSDVDWIVNAILPTLPAGVVIHFHDVFLPENYPAAWAWRGYNEQLALAALLGTGAYAPIFASHYVATAMRARLERSFIAALPLLDGAFESSLWMVKMQSTAH